MTNKFFIQLAIVAFAVLILALAVIGGISYRHPTAPQPVAHQQLPAPTGLIVRQYQTIAPPPEEPGQEVQTPIFTEPLDHPVNVSDLQSLAASVHLKKTNLGEMDRSLWKKALPQAQKLLQGACDCEERNWLNHFVETGNAALTDPKEYLESAKLLVSLPKNDDEATKHQVSD